MIPVIPYKHIRISTALTVEEAMRLVSSAISPLRILDNWSTPTGKEFEGSVTQQGFKIQKIIHHRNSFLPILYGKFIPTENGTKVDVYLTLDVLMIIFVCVWLAGFGGVFLWLVRNSIITGKWDNDIWLTLAGMAFFYLWIFLGFGLYARATEQFIINLFSSYKIEQV
jgi:hypothetical protein